MKQRALLVFLGAVFVLKATVALQLDRHPLLQPETGLDTTAYVALAKRVAAGDLALGPGLYYVAPLYIYFLALIYAVTKSFTAARLVQAALGTVAVGLMFAMARDWFGRRAAWFAAVLAALTGVFTYYEALILQSSLDVFLAALALWLLAKQRWLLAGAAFGIAALNRPNMLVAAVPIALLLIAMRRFKPGVLLLAGVLAGVAPVAMRNVVVARQWSLVSSHGGINFYIGNGPGATGYFHAVPGMRSTIEGLAQDARRVAEGATGRRLTDAEVSAYYTGATWSWIRQHPGAWVALLLRKTYGVFNAAHVSTPFSYTFYAYDAGTLLRFCFVGPWLLIPLGVFGLLLAKPRVWMLFVPAYAGSIVLFFITERYKLPLFVPMAVGSGAALDWLTRHFDVKRGAALAALFVAANWPLHLDDGRAEERTRMAEYYAGRGDVAEGERWTALALAMAPDPAAVDVRVGGQYINSRQAQPAIDHLRAADQLHPNDARTEYLLGRALLGGGRPAEAAPVLQRAIDHHVDVPLAGYDLAVALQQTGDLAGAAKALRAVVPPPDTDVEVLLQLGKRAGEINAPDLAEVFFRRAVAAAPRLGRAHHLLGLALLVMRRYDEAAVEFTTALQLDPNNADARAALAYCERRRVTAR
ncbi:MAG TPA: glycosyltransferase family 39 protein [Thermoanaerobaculia bacterium]|nr:glycosyltransferase family 39 protein [Thermoanaerobaculia bacterium]